MPQVVEDASFDCVSCGACCFSKNPRYLMLLGWDASRRLPPDSLFEEGGRTFVRFDCGHCVHLELEGGKAVCGVYEERPEACRAFRAGSFECIKARRENGVLGEKVRPVAPVEALVGAVEVGAGAAHGPVGLGAD